MSWVTKELVSSHWEQETFLFLKHPNHLWGSLSFLLSEKQEFIFWGKMGRSDTDHLSPPIVKVKNVWSYTSSPPYALMMWCLFKQAYIG